MAIPKLTDKRVVLKRIAAVREVVQAEITSHSKSGDLYAHGLSTEGFAGGYLQALDDIDGAITHGYPSDHRGYWAIADRNLAAQKRTRKNG
jgi:hypothetical protein